MKLIVKDQQNPRLIKQVIKLIEFCELAMTIPVQQRFQWRTII